jgi:hypothetical protein
VQDRGCEETQEARTLSLEPPGRAFAARIKVQPDTPVPPRLLLRRLLARADGARASRSEQTAEKRAGGLLRGLLRPPSASFAASFGLLLRRLLAERR